MFEARGALFVLLDVCCLIVVGLPFAILTSQLNPFKRGFFCNDDSIKYPLREETISHQLLGGIMIPSVLLSMIIGECISVYLKHIKSKSSTRNNYVVSVYKAVGSYLFGAAMNQSMTDIAKYSIGRLRPYFLAACQPMWEKIDCKPGIYIENITCTGEDTLVDEARLSFYSGHSSFSMYSMVFLTLYLQARLQVEWARLVRPTVQFFLIAAAVYVGLSRVSDYKHHWSDVLAGFALGGLIAILTVEYVSDFFRTPVAPSKEEGPDIPHSSLCESPNNGNHYNTQRDQAN
ncbi:hypothetical protein GJAV_G00026950 [Gymnothorax javanicus]|nr:hypothetical protein GJAV_G00026950 [Gymnothorax javanicus]